MPRRFARRIAIGLGRLGTGRTASPPHFAQFTGLSLLALVACGCNRGPEIALVRGRVTLDGNPLPAATVAFEPEVGRASFGRTADDGTYELRYTREEMGAQVGPHAVRILSATEVTHPDGRFEIRPQVVPPRYNTESELRREVASGAENVFDFDLSSKKK